MYDLGHIKSGGNASDFALYGVKSFLLHKKRKGGIADVVKFSESSD